MLEIALLVHLALDLDVRLVDRLWIRDGGIMRPFGFDVFLALRETGEKLLHIRVQTLHMIAEFQRAFRERGVLGGVRLHLHRQPPDAGAQLQPLRGKIAAYLGTCFKKIGSHLGIYIREREICKYPLLGKIRPFQEYIPGESGRSSGRMKKALLTGGLLLAMMLSGGCRKKPPLTAPRAIPVRGDGALELRLTTFNIRNEGNRDPNERAWSNRTSGAVRLIRKLDPDVLGMQELSHGQAADLWASLPEYEFFGRARENGERKGEYAGIFYRADRFSPGGEGGTFWLSGTPEKPGSATWGNSYPRVATWLRLVDRASGRGFYVFNTHLDHRHQGSREEAAVLIAKRIEGRRNATEPVILLGDFNAELTNPALAYLSGRAGTVAGSQRQWKSPLTETYQSLHPGGKAPKTLHFWGTREGWKVDHILVSKGARVLDAAVAPDTLPFSSDHFPVTARVVFP